MPIDFEIQQGLPFVFTNLPNLVFRGVHWCPVLFTCVRYLVSFTLVSHFNGILKEISNEIILTL